MNNEWGVGYTLLMAALHQIAPTLLGIAALIGARKQGKKLDEVRHNTNGAMTDALREIAVLREEIATLKEKAAP